MPDFQTSISFSQNLSEKRIFKANKLLGVKPVNRIIGIALFLLGGNREHISKFLKIPMGTFFSLLTRFHHNGVSAFVHQRTKQQQQSDRTIINITDTTDTPIGLDIVFGEQRKRLNIPVDKNNIIINSSNQLQFKTLILTFMNSGFLKAKEASEILGLSERHVRELNNALQRDDIMSLIDNRQGQQKDYVFTEDIKAELIKQYSANIMTERSTSSREITKQLNEACNCNISDRAVRQHILKLGLNKIKGTLPNLLDDLKKKLHNIVNKFHWEAMLTANEQQKITPAQEKLVTERNKIITLNSANISRREISAFSGRHISTIARNIKRAEHGEALQDRPRSGRPVTFTELTQLKITAFFCQFNPLPGCNSISFNWAAEYFKQNPSFLDDTISCSSIGRILRKHSLKPHLHKYFLQITDPHFFDIMPSIINLYLNPPENLFSFDECPGIQALRKVAPPLPSGNGKRGIRYSEPNHNRMGTIDLYAFFNVNSGHVFAECTENHQVGTLIRVFKRHVFTFPDNAVIHYVSDNLSNHSCHQFCRVVAELSGVDYPEKELDTKYKRQQWLQQEDKRIIMHFTPKHGSWLNMVEIWFGILGQKCLKYNSSQNTDELAAFIEDFIETWNKYYAHPFNWTYDGSGLHSQAVKRFARHLILENKHLELSFLSNQMELMLNLLQHYFNHVNIKYWRSLAEIIKEKKNYIKNIIETSDKPRLKKKALEKFPELLEVLNDKFKSNIKLAA